MWTFYKWSIFEFVSFFIPQTLKPETVIEYTTTIVNLLGFLC